MNTRSVINPILLIMIAGIVSFKNTKQQGNEPWKQDQLLEPSTLATILDNRSEKQPVIYSIGYGVV